MTAGSTVLVAEDSLVIRAVVRHRLEQEGYTVLEAEDGPTAIAVCHQEHPDVVLLDIEMPGLDGHQVLACLKGDPSLEDIPVVFLTIRTGIDDILAGLRGGAHDYLKKPFEPAELLARVGAAVRVKQLEDDLRQRNVELEQISRTDMLTGLANRRHLEAQLLDHVKVARRHRDSLAVVLFDVDHFKQINDTEGHHGGDIVLRVFADRLHQVLRVEDIAGRWGGEEFLVILPRTDLDGALRFGERVRLAAAAPVRIQSHDVTVTISGGCAAGIAEDGDNLVRRADEGLYRAKASGRNRIAAVTVTG